MFMLVSFADLVQIPPHEFYKKMRDEIEDKINEKYSNKVVQKVGLCICMYDLLKASDGLIGHGNGNLNVKVEFRMIVFRPFKGEIIKGTIKKNTAKGLQITTQFFDDVFIPQTMLFEGTQFDETERVWVWRNEDSALWFDNGTVVNVRVEGERWQDQAAKGSVSHGEAQAESSYTIEASITETGLGFLGWW